MGSNKGDKLKNLRAAVDSINNQDKTAVEKVSSLYETKPYGVKEQENFYNAAAKIKTDFDLVELFYFLKSIEMDLGRIKKEKWGPREIDLDILFYNDNIYHDEVLDVPHSEIEKRDFVLVPLCEIENGIIHPVTHKKICEFDKREIEKHIIKKLEVSIFN